MSSIVPPSLNTPPAVAPLPRITVLAPPPALLSLPLGSSLDVSVGTLKDAMNLVVQTSFGDLALRLPSPARVAVGDKLILQWLGAPQSQGLGLGQGQAGLAGRAQLSLPNGKPLAFGAQQATQGGTNTAGAVNAGGAGAVGAASAPNAPTIPRLQAGLNITALLLRPIIIGGPQATLLPTGTPATLAGTPGAPAGSPTQTTATPATGAAASHSGSPKAGASGQPTGAQPTQQALSYGSGSTLGLKIIQIRPPEGTPPSLIPAPAGGAVSLAPGATLTGTVTGQHTLTHAVVQTHAGPISIASQQPLAPGTQLTFEVTGLKPPVPQTASHGLGANQGALGDGIWQAFDESLEALRDVAPGAQMQILQTSMPRADPQLTANILFFIAALRGGDLKGWMGDGPLRILDRQRPDLAARLRDDVGQMSRTVNDPETGDWRQYMVPFINGAEIDRIAMLVRDRDADADDADKEGGSRFVIDLNLSKLGHIQIDGLVGERGKRLDVVVRTDAPLTPEMRHDIRGLYSNAIEVTGLEGSVGFQAAPGNFIAVAPPTAGLNDSVVI